MKKAGIILAIITLVIGLFIILNLYSQDKFATPNVANPFINPTPKPLLKYTIENLTKNQPQQSQIEVGEIIKDELTYQSRYFYYKVEDKKVSGLINLPKTPGTYPVIVMFRGYVDPKEYQTGIGTQRAGEYLVQNGYVTLAPDFLGYGKSDKEADSSIESRFQTYTTAITLLNSLGNLNQKIAPYSVQIDPNKVGIWAHSNGGQIALTSLEIIKKPYPTVLWAPVTKPFPYNILYFTDDIKDHGKALRKVVAEFESDYDSEMYSLTNYLRRISAPIQLHQGSADEAVPQRWSDQFTQEMEKLEKEVEYFVYPGADHNLAGGWPEAVARSLAFFNKHLTQ